MSARRRNRTAWKLRQFENFTPLCYWCEEALKKKTATVDHVIPKFHGGPSSYDNYVIACQPCNRQRSIITSLYIEAIKVKNEKRLKRILILKEKKYEILMKWIKLYQEKLSDSAQVECLREINFVINFGSSQ